VLPQVHACSATAAATIFENMGIGQTTTVDYMAVKSAFEACYTDMGITCADIGGLWNSATDGYYADGDSDASPCTDAEVTSYPELLTYIPGSQVTDHANIDLDQKAMEAQLSDFDFATAQAIYETGAHSKPTAICDLGGSDATAAAISKGDTITFTAKSGAVATGKAYEDYDAGATQIAFTYSVSGATRTEDLSKQCYAGGLPSADQSTLGCISTASDGTSAFSVGSTTFQGATCTNRGKRTLQGFSTGAEGKMYTCSVTPPAGATYSVGCPYTTYEPYYDYYGDFSYADTIVSAALNGDNGAAGFTNGGFDLTGAADVTRQELTKKGTAYMNTWMYVLREFEDAIDDCAIGDLTANAHSSGPVHAWDEGVAFYAGSLMVPDDLLDLPTLDDKGKLAYTLANKRCQNYLTCGPDGNSAIGEAKANIELFDLFNNGQAHLIIGECAEVVAVKDAILTRMTVPLVQGTLRYAYKVAHLSGGDKEKAEGAIFAAAVLPQVHACSATAAATVFQNMGIGQTTTVDYMAVKEAFEGCYAAMGITCADVGGLWNSATEGYYADGGSDASPCADPEPDVETVTVTVTETEIEYVNNTVTVPGEKGDDKEVMPAWALPVIIVAGLLAVCLCIFLCVVYKREKEGKPMFTPLTVGKPGSAGSA